MIYFRYENDFGQIREGEIQFEGVLRNIERRYKETSSDFIREQMEQYMSQKSCPTCKGYRLKKEALAVLIDGRHIGTITELSVGNALAFFKGLTLSEKDMKIADMILREIMERLSFLDKVGLDYLTLSRAAGTLSGERRDASGWRRKSARAYPVCFIF